MTWATNGNTVNDLHQDPFYEVYSNQLILQNKQILFYWNVYPNSISQTGHSIRWLCACNFYFFLFFLHKFCINEMGHLKPHYRE